MYKRRGLVRFRWYVALCLSILSTTVTPLFASETWDCKTSLAKAGEKIFKNDLVYQGATMAENARFALQQRFDGSVAFPQDTRLTYSIGEGGSATSFRTGSIDRQNRDLRNLFKNLKQRSILKSPAREIIYSALIIVFEDGTSLVSRTTSRREDTLNPDDVVFGAIRAMVSKNKYHQPIKKILSIQTRPQPHSSQEIKPARADYLYLSTLQAQLSFDKVSPQVEGVILPSCENCGNLFFEFVSADLRHR